MDNDKFFRGLAPYWRKVYVAVKTGASPEEVARLCSAALAGFLQEKGCPGFEKGREVLGPLCNKEAQLAFGADSYDDICASCDDIAHSYAGTSHAATACYVLQAVKDLAFKPQMGEPLYGEVGVLLAEQVGFEMVWSSVIAKLDGTKAMETFIAKSNNDLERAQNELYDWKLKLAELLPEALRSVTQKLADDSSGKTVKARSVRIPRRSTLEILSGWGRLDTIEVDNEVII